MTAAAGRNTSTNKENGVGDPDLESRENLLATQKVVSKELKPKLPLPELGVS